MDELVENHSRVMRVVGKGRPLGLVVDEWGTWYDVEEGTNPGFLYQQNAMRDAVAAAINLNIFNNHCDTVVMANIAQTVNVLQAMILTEGDRMLLTPTYHVFEMYKGHQDAQQLECYAQAAMTGPDNARVPKLHASASRNENGDVLLTVANLDESECCPVSCIAADLSFTVVEARVMTGDPRAHNTFDLPHQVQPTALAVSVEDGEFAAVLPPCSVCAFTLKA